MFVCEKERKLERVRKRRDTDRHRIDIERERKQEEMRKDIGYQRKLNQ